MPDDDATGAPNGDEEKELREAAEKRVEERMRLLGHVASYIIVNGFLVLIWALTGRGYPWFVWVMAGWGIGLLFHVTGFFIGLRGSAAHERMVSKEMDRIKEGK